MRGIGDAGQVAERAQSLGGLAQLKTGEIVQRFGESDIMQVELPAGAGAEDPPELRARCRPRTDARQQRTRVRAP